MGKARIVENLGDGYYRIAVITNPPAEDPPVRFAWCIDYSDTIPVDTIVGTIEVGGIGYEYRNGKLLAPYLIKAGYDEAFPGITATWAEEDGIQSPPGNVTPSGFYWNAALQPGWQKWMPTARTGIIESVDHETDTATVIIRPALEPIMALPLEPSTLTEATLEEDPPAYDPHWIQLTDFCERNPAHPACQDIGERTSVDHDTWWDTIVQVNTEVNEDIYYMRDGDADSWNVVDGSGPGDCEDYALTKMKRLADEGFPASAMGLCVGKIGSGPQRGVNEVDHGWCVVFTTKGMFHLDQAPDVPTQRQPGVNFRVLRYGNYEIVARKLEDVPIRYMYCNSYPFAVGDDVVVQFDEQSWDNPVVTGFVQYPKPCGIAETILFVSEEWKVYVTINGETERVEALEESFGGYSTRRFLRISDRYIVKHCFQGELDGSRNGAVRLYRRHDYAVVDTIEYENTLQDVSYRGESDYRIYTTDRQGDDAQYGGLLRVNGDSLGVTVLHARYFDNHLWGVEPLGANFGHLGTIYKFTRDGELVNTYYLDENVESPSAPVFDGTYIYFSGIHVIEETPEAYLHRPGAFRYHAADLSPAGMLLNGYMFSSPMSNGYPIPPDDGPPYSYFYHFIHPYSGGFFTIGVLPGKVLYMRHYNDYLGEGPGHIVSFPVYAGLMHEDVLTVEAGPEAGDIADWLVRSTTTLGDV